MSGPNPPPLLRIEIATTPDVVDVRLYGEMDLSTRGQLTDALAGTRLDGAHSVRLDMQGVEFCDAAGLTELVETHSSMAAQERSCSAHDASPSLLRLLTLTGLTGLLGATL